MKNFLKKLRILWRIAGTYEDDRMHDNASFNSRLGSVQRSVTDLERLIAKHTTVGASIGPTMKDANYVIVLGRYRGTDYVDVHALHPGNFDHIVHELKSLTKRGEAFIVDAPRGMREVFKRKVDAT